MIHELHRLDSLWIKAEGLEDALRLTRAELRSLHDRPQDLEALRVKGLIFKPLDELAEVVLAQGT